MSTAQIDGMRGAALEPPLPPLRVSADSADLKPIRRREYVARDLCGATGTFVACPRSKCTSAWWQ